jgi:hypothetical protein
VIPNRPAPELTDNPDIRIVPFTEEGVAERNVLPEPKGSPWAVRWTPKILAEVLNEISNCGVYYRSCIARGVGYDQFLKLRKTVKEIEELAEMALEFYRQKISHTVHNRAVAGWEEPVFYKGECVGYVRRFSDRLLELQAKRHCPEYRDRSQMDLNVAGGVLLITGTRPDKEAFLDEHRKRKPVVSREVPR